MEGILLGHHYLHHRNLVFFPRKLDNVSMIKEWCMALYCNNECWKIYIAPNYIEYWIRK